MSSQSDLIGSLILAQKNLYKFGGPILMSLGTVSCILSLIVFTKKILRKNPCSIYFVAFNVSNILLIYPSILFTTLASGYSIDPGLYSLIYCRFRSYTTLLFTVLSPSYLILASVDRILITSPDASTRQRSTPRLAYICIIIVTLFWLLFHIHALIFTNIIQIASSFVACYFQPGLQVTLIGYYSLFVKGILVPLLMIISGLWAVKNIRSIGRVAPAPISTVTGAAFIGGLRSIHSKDHQLIKILLVDISVYIIFSLMASVVSCTSKLLNISQIV